MAQGLDDAGGGLVGAPDEDGRAGAGDRRPQGAEGARAADELHRARVEVLAARLVQAVVEAAGDEVPVAARQAEDEQRAMGGVEHGVGHRDLGGQRRARGLRAHRRARHDDDRLQARRGGRAAGGVGGPPGGGGRAPPAWRRGGGSKRVASPSAPMTKPPCSAAATLSGWPSSSLASASRSASSSKRWSAAIRPATYAAA